MSAPEVRLFNVQGLRYAEDNRRVDLASKDLAVEVDHDGRAHLLAGVDVPLQRVPHRVKPRIARTAQLSHDR